MATCFLDCEFTNFDAPALLSLALVDLSGNEHYVELDLDSDVGRERVKASSDFVREGGVLDQWGRVEGAKSLPWTMGRRTGEWLLGLADHTRTRVDVCFDYPTDWALLEGAIRESGLWHRVEGVVNPVDVAMLTGNIESELAAEACFESLRARDLRRHHALADALALRASYKSIKGVSVLMARAVHSGNFRRLVDFAKTNKLHYFDEARLRSWLMQHAPGLGGRRPAEVITEPGGLELVQDLMGRIEHGVYS
jgi:Protein of unknown function (DUF2384)